MKKFIKSLLAFALCVAFGLFALTGCGTNATPSKDQAQEKETHEPKTSITIPLEALKNDPLAQIKPDEKDLTRKEYNDHVRAIAKKFIEFANLPENGHWKSTELFHAFTEKYPDIAKLQTPMSTVMNYRDKINKEKGNDKQDLTRATFYNLPVASEIMMEDKMLIKETLKNGMLVEFKENGDLAVTSTTEEQKTDK